jgi:hypothetical protein
MAKDVLGADTTYETEISAGVSAIPVQPPVTFAFGAALPIAMVLFAPTRSAFGGGMRVAGVILCWVRSARGAKVHPPAQRQASFCVLARPWSSSRWNRQAERNGGLVAATRRSGSYKAQLRGDRINSHGE